MRLRVAKILRWNHMEQSFFVHSTRTRTSNLRGVNRLSRTKKRMRSRTGTNESP